jgi:hypothetical protein
MTANNPADYDENDEYDEAIADIATAVAAEASLDWGLDWAYATDRAINWIRIERYAHELARRNLDDPLDPLTDEQRQHIAHATGHTTDTLKTTYPPQPES